MAEKIIITELKFKRIILHLSGRFSSSLNEEEMIPVFINEDRDSIIYPQFYKQAGKEFKLFINLLSANHDWPMLTGLYYLVFLKKDDTVDREVQEASLINRKLVRQEVQADIAEEIKEKMLKNNNCEEFKLKIDITAREYFYASVCTDLDTEKFYIDVEYQVPPESPGFWKRKAEKLRHHYFMINKSAFVFTFNLLTKAIKKKGNRIFFTSASRGEIGGNEKFVYDRMLERGLDDKYKFRFHFRASLRNRENIFRRLRFTFLLATSDIIIVDDYLPILYQVEYPQEVKIIQVWHACGAFKAVGMERVGKPGGPRLTQSNHKCYTHVPVSSEHSGRHCAEAFCISQDKFYPVGIPRTDIFFDEKYKENIKKNLYAEYPSVKKAKKIYLYAPTFRGNGAGSAYFPFEKIDLERWGKFCKDTQSILFVKMHPFISGKIVIPNEYKGVIIDASPYREVNDLLFIVDVLITDYSSVIYEFSLLNRPMLFYVFDLRMYEQSRDFYEPFEEIVPGKIVKRFDELIAALETSDYEEYKLSGFVEKNFKYTDGNSTDRVIDQLILDKNGRD